MKIKLNKLELVKEPGIGKGGGKAKRQGTTDHCSIAAFSTQSSLDRQKCFDAHSYLLPHTQDRPHLHIETANTPEITTDGKSHHSVEIMLPSPTSML